eukprot:598232-Pyramimonas_sp.AAC.1
MPVAGELRGVDHGVTRWRPDARASDRPRRRGVHRAGAWWRGASSRGLAEVPVPTRDRRPGAPREGDRGS